MKRIIIYMLAVWCATALTACDFKEDRIFDQTPDERLAAVLNEYSTAMESAHDGWLMQIATKVDGGYQLYMSFNDRDRVVMLCDMDATFATQVAMSSVLRESSYKLKALQVPSLIFDTYNYIHQMADPKKDENGMSSNGTGLQSDYEFGIMNYDSRQFTLLGIYNKCQAYMRQATAEEARAALDGGLKGVFEKLTAYLAAIPSPVVTIGEQVVDVTITGRKVTFSSTDAESGAVTTQSVAMYQNLRSVIDEQVPVSDITLFDAVTVAGVTIKGFSWNGSALEAVTTQGVSGIVLHAK